MMQQKSFDPLHRPPSLPESVQHAIRNYISDNNLKSGDPLPPETHLTKQLGVSRNAVREAVKALEMTGIVEVRRGSGLFVGDFSLDPLLESLPYGLVTDLQELRELLEIRQVLETGMVGRVLATATQVQVDQLYDTLERMKARASQKKPFPDEDREFHQRMFEHIGNHTLLKLLDIFWQTYNRAARNDEISDYDPMKTYLDHVAIVQAFEAKDAEGLKRALEQHYNGLGSLSFRLNRAERVQITPVDDEDAS